MVSPYIADWEWPLRKYINYLLKDVSCCPQVMDPCLPFVRLLTIHHYGDVRMGAKASQITSLTIVYSTVYSDADQSKHQSSASLAFVRGIHRGPVNSPHKWPVTRKMFPFDDVIMCYSVLMCIWSIECVGLGRFIEKSNDLITSELSLADDIWWCKWVLCAWIILCARGGRWETALLVTSFLAVTGEFPAQKPVTRSFDVFFDLRLNKRLSKQSLGW